MTVTEFDPTFQHQFVKCIGMSKGKQWQHQIFLRSYIRRVENSTWKFYSFNLQNESAEEFVVAYCTTDWNITTSALRFPAASNNFRNYHKIYLRNIHTYFTYSHNALTTFESLILNVFHEYTFTSTLNFTLCLEKVPTTYVFLLLSDCTAVSVHYAYEQLVTFS
jgi:hypothetical protein